MKKLFEPVDELTGEAGSEANDSVRSSEADATFSVDAEAPLTSDSIAMSKALAIVGRF
jgi:hypothetical protein